MRRQFRQAADALHDIFKNIVLYDPPEAQLNLARLLEERNNAMLAAAREYRTWLAANPQAHVGNPDAADITELSCDMP
jgi:hypothetical protein